MILTQELFEQGKSCNGGWNLKQVQCFGIDKWKKGWMRKIVGHDWPQEVINKFLSLKDAHNNGIPKNKKAPGINFVDAPKLPWKDQYLHPNWQKMRLHVLKRDHFRCINCKATDKTLHCHHLKYNRNGAIWDVPHWYIVTLCEDCHSEEHGRDLTIKNAPAF